jgi:hypothetical protein
VVAAPRLGCHMPAAKRLVGILEGLQPRVACLSRVILSWSSVARQKVTQAVRNWARPNRELVISSGTIGIVAQRGAAQAGIGPRLRRCAALNQWVVAVFLGRPWLRQGCPPKGRRCCSRRWTSRHRRLRARCYRTFSRGRPFCLTVNYLAVTYDASQASYEEYD